MVKAFLVRLNLTYLLVYFLFISNYFVFFFPFIGFVHKPLSFIASNFIELVNKLFIHKPFYGNITLDDNYWLYISVASFFVLSILIAFTWTLIAKRKSQDRLFFYLHTYARYYLAFVLLVYGFSKVFGNQFSEPSPNVLIETIGRLDPHSLMWLFRGHHVLIVFLEEL
jgi:hypothetical protein